jgi:hypothetical protein
VPIALVYAAISVPAAMRREVTQMRLFTSLAAVTHALGDREDGETLGYEAVTLALIIFAVLGVISLVGRLG